MNVYIVTAYRKWSEDRKIVCVFASRQDAEKYVDTNPDPDYWDYEIEEHTVMEIAE